MKISTPAASAIFCCTSDSVTIRSPATGKQWLLMVIGFNPHLVWKIAYCLLDTCGVPFLASEHAATFLIPPLHRLGRGSAVEKTSVSTCGVRLLFRLASHVCYGSAINGETRRTAGSTLVLNHSDPRAARVIES